MHPCYDPAVIIASHAAPIRPMEMIGYLRWFLPLLIGSCLLYCLIIYHGAATGGLDWYDDGSVPHTGRQDQVSVAGLDWDDLVYLLAGVSSLPPPHPVNNTCLPPLLYDRAGGGRGVSPSSPPASCDHGTVLTGKIRTKARRLFMMLLFR